FLEQFGRSVHVRRGIDSQTQVMQAGRIRIVTQRRARRTQYVAEEPVVVLNVRIAVDREFIFPKIEIRKDTIVKFFRARENRNSDVDVIDTDYFNHRARLSRDCLKQSYRRPASCRGWKPCSKIRGAALV